MKEKYKEIKENLKNNEILESIRLINSIELAALFKDEIDLIEFQFKNNQKDESFGIHDIDYLNRVKSQIVLKLLKILNRIEEKDISRIELKNPIYAFEFDLKSKQWIPVSPKENFIQPNKENDLKKKILFPNEYLFEKNVFLLGLPKTGKTTFLKSTLHELSKDKGVNTVYIPGAIKESEILSLIRKCPIYTNNNKIYYGLDDRKSYDFLNEFELPKSNKICIIPNEISQMAIYANNISYHEPVEKEILQKLLENYQNKIGYKLPDIFVGNIINYCGGIPEIGINLINYFLDCGYLPDPNKINELKKDLPPINNLINFISKYTELGENVEKTIFGLFATGKTIKKFHSTLNIPLPKEAILLNKIGLNKVLLSNFLRTLLFKSLYKESDVFSLHEKIVGLLDENEKKKKNIWTPDMNRRSYEEISLPEIAVDIMKDNSYLVDWSKVKINGKIVDYSYYPKNGDFIQILHGKRNKKEVFNNIKTQIKDESKVHFIEKFNRINNQRKQQRELIELGDIECKKLEWKKAETFYLKAIKISKDSNRAKVRFANLLRIRGKIDESLIETKKIIRSSPNPFAFMCHGINLFLKGDVVRSIRYFDEALSIKKNYVNALTWKARALLHINKIMKADSLCDDIVKIRLSYLKKKKYSYKVTRPSLEEKIIRMIILLNLENTNAFRNISKEIEDKFYNRIMSNPKTELSSLPLYAFLLYLNKSDKFTKFENRGREILNKAEGIKINIFMWENLINWEDEQFSGLQKGILS